MMKSVVFLIAFTLMLSVSFAQSPSKWIHTGISMVAYKGDLSNYEKYSAAFHVGLQFNKKKRLNGGFNLGFGSVTGEDRTFTLPPQSSKTPNRFFKTNFLYLNYDLHVNLVKKENFILYLSQGIGFIRFTPTDQFGDKLQDQPSTREDDETYRNAAIMLPTKIGAMYFVANYFGVGLQAGFAGTMTDYLDNISQLADTDNDNMLQYRIAFYIPIYRTQE